MTTSTPRPETCYSVVYKRMLTLNVLAGSQVKASSELFRLFSFSLDLCLYMPHEFFLLRSLQN